ncbi:MAG TPA: hypothetical protein VGE74_32260 [Gemmata sp.]
MFRLFRRALGFVLALALLRQPSAPYATRFNRFVILGVPGFGSLQLTHEEAQSLAEQLAPTFTRR